MKQAFTLDKHSFVDVITNSSTELFVCDENKSLELIENILQQIVVNYNEEQVPHDEWAYPTTYEQTFDKPYVYTQEMYDKVKKEGYGCCSYESQETVGKIIIEGANDNSIPDGVSERLENVLNTNRYYLG